NDAAPVEWACESLPLWRRDGHDFTRAGPNRVQIGQADRAAAEHLVIVEKLDENAILRLELKVLAKLGVNLFEVFGHEFGEELVVLRIEAEVVVLGLNRFIFRKMIEHLDRIGDSNVEAIPLERFRKQFFRFLLLAEPQIEHAEPGLGGRQLIAKLDRLLEVDLGVAVDLAIFERRTE